jgi:DNA-binding transcriptional LysR family regulator
MDFHQLKHFLLLAERLNFRRTAEEIYIAQPALSRQIQQLEAEVGALLFRRDKRTVTLTAAGHYFQKEAHRLVEQWEQARRRTGQIHRGEAGEIRIGHATSAMHSILPRLLVRVREQTPDLHVQLTETSNLSQVGALLDRRIDVGLGPNLVVPPAIGQRIVYRENFVLVLPGSHPLNRETFRDLSQVAGEHFIIPPKAEGMGYVETLEDLCGHYGFTPTIHYESHGRGPGAPFGHARPAA